MVLKNRRLSGRIQAVLFDLDGTLRHSRPSFYDTFFQAAIDLAAPDTPDGRLRAKRWLHYYWAQSPELLDDLQTYEEQQEEFWTNHYYQALLNFGCSQEQASSLAPPVYEYMAEDFIPNDWVSPDVPPTLEALKGAGIRLAVVSNRTKSYQEQLDAMGLAGYFEFSLAAGELDTWKPEPEIFYHAIRRMDVTPERTIYVGDNYYADVIGAERAGIHPVLLDPEGLFPEAACSVISSLGVLKDILEKNG